MHNINSIKESKDIHHHYLVHRRTY